MENTQIPKDPNTQRLAKAELDELKELREGVHNGLTSPLAYHERLRALAPKLIAAGEEVEKLRASEKHMREWGGRCQQEMEHQAARALDLRVENERYHELLIAVARKFPEESRHATALRYIRAMEATAAAGPVDTAALPGRPAAPTI